MVRTPDTIQAVFREMGFPSARAWLPGAVAYSVGRTYSLLIRELARVYGRHGLSAPSFNLLMLLRYGADPDRMTQQEVGKRLVVSASDMTGLIDRLEDKGLVRRTPGKDRRSKLLRITPKGATLVGNVWPHHAETVKRLCGGLSQRDAHALVRAAACLRERCG